MITAYMEICRMQKIQHIHVPDLMINEKHVIFVKLTQEIESFQHELSMQNLVDETSDKFLSLLDQHNNIVSLEESIHQLTFIIYHCDPIVMHKIIVTMIESIDVILMTAITALESHDPMDIEVLIEITHDRKAFLEEMRDSYLSQVPSISITTKSSVLLLTSLTERIVWIFRRLGLIASNRPSSN